MADIDADLLVSTGVVRPRVVVLPTASYPDGEEVFQRWASMGMRTSPRWARGRARPGARSRRRGRSGAAQAVGEADLVYLSGVANPLHLRRALEGTAASAALLAAHDRGAVLAGCSAGAMILAGHAVRVPGRAPALAAALGSGPVVPRRVGHSSYHTWPEPFSALIALQAPRGSVLLGSTKRPSSSAATAGGRCTAPRASLSARTTPRTVRAGDTFRIQEDCTPHRRRGRSLLGPRVPSRTARISVGANRPEAVGAVDRAVHAGLEGDLRLVATGRAHHREVLAVGAIIAALVAPRAADVSDVVAAVAGSSPAGAQLVQRFGSLENPSGRSTPGRRRWMNSTPQSTQFRVRST